MSQILTCAILCASGYEENSLRRAQTLLANYPIQSCLLGLVSGPVAGADGRRLQTDGAISSLLADRERPFPTGLLLAGGAACHSQLMADPRVHLLMQQMLAASSVVGLLAPVSFQLVQTLDAPGSHHLLLQNRQSTPAFMAEFMQKLAAQR